MKVDKINKAPNIKGVRHSYLLYEVYIILDFVRFTKKNKALNLFKKKRLL